MSFHKQSETNKPKPTEDDTSFAHWGALAGAALGLILTAIAGHWFANIAMLGSLGYFIGALVDRSRK